MNRTLALLLAAALLAAAGTAAAQESTIDDDQEFVVSFTPTELQLNPIHTFTTTEAQVYTAIYEGLVSYDPTTLEPVPATARTWSISADGTVYTFNIRENARYWNGDRVKAQDFRDTWLKLLDPAENAEYASLFDIIAGAEDYRTGKTTDPATVGIKARSDTRLEVSLTGPATHFLKVLCNQSFVPIHPSMLAKESWREAAEIPGNGPYYIDSRSGEEMVLKKNEYYWDSDRVSFPRMRFLFIEDPDRVSQLYNKGKIDWIAGNFNFDLINNKGSTVFNPLFATQYFYFNEEKAPWNKPEVRRALSLVLPWEEIRKNAAIPARTLVPPISSYPELQGVVGGSAEEAKKLLNEAGFSTPSQLPQIVIAIPDESVEIRRIAALMAAAWKGTLDIDVKIEAVPGASYFNGLSDVEHTLAMLTWIGDFADPLTFLQMWTANSSLNEANYRNPEFDGLIRESMSMSGEERYKKLGEAEAILLDSAAVLPLSHTPAINLIDLDLVDGWYENPLDVHPFKYIKYAEFKPLNGIAMSSSARSSMFN